MCPALLLLSTWFVSWLDRVMGADGKSLTRSMKSQRIQAAPECDEHTKRARHGRLNRRFSSGNPGAMPHEQLVSESHLAASTACGFSRICRGRRCGPQSRRA